MNQLAHGITVKPYSINKSGEKGISISITFRTDRLKAPFKFIENLYKKSALNDFKNIFSASVE